MATVDSYFTCPQCKYEEAHSSLSTRTLEEHSFCPICGYREWLTLVRDRTDPRKPKLKRTKEGRWMFRRYTRKGLGAYWITLKDGGGAVGSFSEAPTQEKLDEFLTQVVNDESVDLAQSYLTVWDEQARQVRFILGRMPDPVQENYSE